MDETLMTDQATLEAAFPLPRDPRICVIARYAEGMREMVQYDISFDGYKVRHDWLTPEGGRVTAPGKDITWQEAHDPEALEEAILKRRKACLIHRGIE
jgi:hypothetical protein